MKKNDDDPEMRKLFNNARIRIKDLQMNYAKRIDPKTLSEDINLSEREIKRKLKDGSITNEMMANALSISVKTYNSYFYDDDNQNQRDPSLGTLIKICKMFNCDLDYILGSPDDNLFPRENGMLKSVDQNLYSLTGLDAAACENLLGSLKRYFLDNELSWFINNGLLEVLKEITNLSFEISRKEFFYNSLPQYAKDEIKSVSKKYTEHDEISTEGEMAISLFIKDLNKECISELQYILSNYEMSNLSYTIHYDYHMALAMAQVSSRHPTSSSDNLEDRVNSLLSLEKEAIQLSHQMQQEDFENARQSWWLYREDTYRKLLSIAVEYVRIDFLKDITLFKASKMFNTMAQKFVADEDVRQAYKVAIKEDLMGD